MLAGPAKRFSDRCATEALPRRVGVISAALSLGVSPYLPTGYIERALHARDPSRGGNSPSSVGAKSGLNESSVADAKYSRRKSPSDGRWFRDAFDGASLTVPQR